MLVVPMCLSNIYRYKISVKTTTICHINTISGLHVSTLSSHQALQRTGPRLSKYIVHSGIPNAYQCGVIIMTVHISS